MALFDLKLSVLFSSKNAFICRTGSGGVLMASVSSKRKLLSSTSGIDTRKSAGFHRCFKKKISILESFLRSGTSNSALSSGRSAIELWIGCINDFSTSSTLTTSPLQMETQFTTCFQLCFHREKRRNSDVRPHCNSRRLDEVDDRSRLQRKRKITC